MLTPDQLLDHANQGFQTRIAREEWARSGVSRLYYACYHFCNKAAESWCSGLPEHLAEKKGHHQKLITRLKNQARQDAIKSHLIDLANMLGKALNERVDADYFLDRQVNEDSYARTLMCGRQIKAKFEEIEKVVAANGQA